jgi:hypothetical protein
MKYDAVDVKYEIRHECGQLESVSVKTLLPNLLRAQTPNHVRENGL